MKWDDLPWEEIHERKGVGLFPLLLGPLSVVYGTGCRVRDMAYRRGMLKSRSLPGFVLSVGNLTVGGTGKTPAVVLLARWARDRGYRVAVLSRGYGGASPEEVTVVSDGHRVKAAPELCGDEPYLLGCKLQGVPVLTARRRYAAGKYAAERFGSEVFILDDGFQHRGLKRDLDLLLLDARSPFGNGQLLPWGPLREPVEAMARADALIITRYQEGAETAWQQELPEEARKIPLFKAVHEPQGVILPHAGEVHPPHMLKGRRVLAFAGIARPSRFRETLLGLGARVIHFRAFRDHHVYEAQEIQALLKEAQAGNCDLLLTTEKDWVRVARKAPVAAHLGYLTVAFRVIPDPEPFYGWLGYALERHSSR